jgi:hypothetical protein
MDLNIDGGLFWNLKLPKELTYVVVWNGAEASTYTLGYTSCYSI